MSGHSFMCFDLRACDCTTMLLHACWYENVGANMGVGGLALVFMLVWFVHSCRCMLVGLCVCVG